MRPLNMAWFRLRDRFSPAHFFGGVATAAVVAYALAAFSDLPFWVCFVLALVGMLVNGWFATWEDQQPEGFNDRNDRHPRH